jgi:hypothetical protein
LIAMALVACAACGGAGKPTAPDTSRGVLVGVTQQGGLPMTRPDGAALLSEAYRVFPDGRVAIAELYADGPAERSAIAEPDDAKRLIALVTSPRWASLQPDDPAATGDEGVIITIETETRTVRRPATTRDPVFRDVLDALQRIRTSSERARAAD